MEWLEPIILMVLMVMLHAERADVTCPGERSQPSLVASKINPARRREERAWVLM